MARSVAVGYYCSKPVSVDAVAAIVAAGDSAATTVASVRDYLELGEVAFGFHDEPVADDPIRICVGAIDQFLLLSPPHDDCDPLTTTMTMIAMTVCTLQVLLRNIP